MKEDPQVILRCGASGLVSLLAPSSLLSPATGKANGGLPSNSPCLPLIMALKHPCCLFWYLILLVLRKRLSGNGFRLALYRSLDAQWL